MADLVNFSVQLVGGNVRVYGQVVDSSNQSTQLATFGPNGQAFDAWYSTLSNEQRLKFVSQQAAPIMARMLMGEPY